MKHTQYQTEQELLLVKQAQAGESAAMAQLLIAYTPLLIQLAKSSRFPLGDLEDRVQEGMMALLRAVQTYRPEIGAAFRTYAVRCAVNAMYNCVQRQNERQIPIDAYASFDEAENLSGPGLCDPQDIVIQREQQDFRRRKIHTLLSGFELDCLQLFLSGYRYQEIAQCLRCTTKSVDNALARTRRKLKAAGLGEQVSF